MRAKEYLRQIRIADERVRSLIHEIDLLRDSISHPKPINYDKDPVQGGSRKDSMADSVAKYVDMERELNKRTDGLIDLRHKIIGEINQLKDPNHIRLLMLRYVDGHTFERIACEMNYSFRQVLRIHGSALQEFERTILHNTNMS